MNKRLTLLIVWLGFSLVFAFAGSDNIRQAFMERAPGKFEPAAYMKAQQEKFDWLMAEAVRLSEKTVVSVQVTEQDMEQIENYKCETCGKHAPMKRRVRVGVVKPVDLKVSGTDPFWPTLDGGFVWTLAAESRAAAALRIHFRDFNLPANAAVYVYNTAGEAFGPYTGRGPTNDGDFWSNTVSGPIAYVQLRHFGPASDSDLYATHFKIAGIGHLGEKFLLPFIQHQKAVEGLSRILEHCSYNEPCVEDASCYSGGAVNDAKKAVAHIQWISGAWIYYCSGGLITDTNVATHIPYFLTANHCLSRAREARNLECYWLYRTASCHAACYDPVGVVPRTLGSDVISTSSKNGDYSLLKLWENPPAGSVFMGWTTMDTAFAAGMELFRISHPSGAPQAYSKHVVDVDAVTCGGWPRGKWIYSRDVIGATEGGSSGSPVYNMNGQIVGQLSGACGYNVNDPCDAVNNATVDGAFAAYFSEIQSWLAPQTSLKMHVQAIDLGIKTRGPNTDAIASVTIVDELGSPVSGAVVTGTFSGEVFGTTSASTDRKGAVVLKISKPGAITSFTFCVDNVIHTSYTYDPSANVETCDTY